jgi:DNA polymerase I
MQLVFDLETDGLLDTVTTIFCCGIYNIDTNESKVLTNEKEILDVLNKATVLIGHNIFGYDLIVLKKLFNFDYQNKTCIDTKLMAQLIYPDRHKGYSLNALSIDLLGDSKLESPMFDKLTDEMIIYCKQDTELTYKLFDFMSDKLTEFDKAFKMEFKFAKYMSYQVHNGFRLDVKATEKLYEDLNTKYIEQKSKLMRIMPPVRDYTLYNKKKAEGKVLDINKNSFTYESGKYGKIREHIFKDDEPNPNSRQQIINFLKERYEWEPSEFTEKNTPKIDETILNGLDYPEAKAFAELFTLSKKMGMIKNERGGWLNFIRGDRVHGQINTIGANTARCTHSKPNMSQCDKAMRQVWIPTEDWKLIDMDCSGLELRLLAHYLFPYDAGNYADIVLNGDVHTYNKEIVGLNERNSAKTFIYALVYGAGNKKLGTVMAEDSNKNNLSDIQLLTSGKKARNKVINDVIGYEELMVDIQTVIKQRKFLKSIDGRKLYPRSDYSALNLLIQSAGAIICKTWTVNTCDLIISKIGFDNWGLCANVHDEIVIEAHPSVVDIIKECGKEAIKLTKEQLNVKIELDIDTHVGDNWAEVH